MTDGQDNTYYGKPGGSETLINQFKSNLKDWKKPLTVHTIGFSSSHDFGFLDELRKSGSVEGVFRYAEPNDVGDSLCQKMSDLATSIISNTALKATLYTPVPIRGAPKPSELVPSTSRYYGDASKKYKTTLSFDMEDGHGRLNLFLDAKASEIATSMESLVVEVGRRDFEFRVECDLESKDGKEKEKEKTEEEEEDKDSFKQWMSYLARDILNRTVMLANFGNKTTSTFFLKCSLLLKQARSIAILVRSDTDLSEQLKMCVEQLENLLRGKEASIARLSDVAQAQNIKVAAPSAVVPSPTSAPATTSSERFRCEHIVNIRTDKTKRSDLHTAVLNGGRGQIELLMRDNPSLCLTVDEEGNTPLHYAACSGRMNVIEMVCLGDQHAKEVENKAGYTPLDLAILCGKWKSVKILIDLGALPGTKQDINESLKVILRHRFYNTAGCLIAARLVTLSNDVLKQQLPASTLEWVMEKMAEADAAPAPRSAAAQQSTETPTDTPEKLALYLKNAVQNGMLNLVKKLLVNDIKPTLDLLFLCGPKGEVGADIAELLLEKGLKPDEDDGSLQLKPEEAFETPLFRAAEKGWDQLLLVLINAGANVNWRNKAGNSPLWIACMNRHLECITELLNAGADPNLANNKGDVPLMCACQRNMCSGVASLLAVGARIDQTDPAINSPVMVCCRLGHDVILETLLSKLSQQADGEEKLRNQLALRATIDGFNPLIAAAEQNKWQCVKVLHKFKADLEFRTTEDNKILQYATALHVAVYYGCVEAALALLEIGASPNSRDLSGRTPLHIAVLQSNAMMVRLLKSFKVDMTIQDNQGHVASFYASSPEIKFEMDDPSLKYLLSIAQSGTLDPELRELLRNDACLPGILKSADCVDIASGDGWSPLMESIVFGNHEFSQFLVELGANPYRKDINGLSAGFWASLLGRNHVNFFGKEIELSKEELNALETFNNMKKLDVRNALLFEIDLQTLRKETEGRTETGLGQESQFLHLAMANGKEKFGSEVPVEIQKTRSKCSVGSFLKTSVTDNSMWAGSVKKPCPNLLLLESLASSAKYLVSKSATGADVVVPTSSSDEDASSLGLQEMAALHVISSDAISFNAMNAGLLSANKSWLPFVTLAMRAVEILPPYVGEVYRGVSTQFNPKFFEVGKEIVWPGFTACTTSWYELLDKEGEQKQGGERAFKYNVMFIIQSTTCAKSVSQFSSCSKSSPALLAPNSKFVVKSLHIADVIGLGQPDCRDTAYKMTDNYLTQAEKKQRPVFVVLEEKK